MVLKFLVGTPVRPAMTEYDIEAAVELDRNSLSVLISPSYLLPEGIVK
jgi:hypothetical protein